MKIYTKTGDAGETGLYGGPRVPKDDARIAAYGDVDELNAALGVVLASQPPREIEHAIARVQHQLFDLGAQLATPDPAAKGTDLIGASQIAWLEEQIDQFETQLAPLKTFILPGGTPAAAQLHTARCICRRAERSVVTLARTESISPNPVTYLNRLSDLLFVLARAANHSAGVADVAWKKSETQ